MKPTGRRKLEILCDAIILIAALLLALLLILIQSFEGFRLWGKIFLTAAILCCAGACIDLIRLSVRRRNASVVLRPRGNRAEASPFTVRELVLLDEGNKPLKSWSLTGRTSMIIGRKNQDEEVDVDLGDCEYGAFIEPQHALLNFSRERWYLEDISEENGVRVKKAEDGGIYRLSGRPCEVGAGDVIYIANTQMLLT